jgi:hypothetical protein
MVKVDGQRAHTNAAFVEHDDRAGVEVIVHCSQATS